MEISDENNASMQYFPLTCVSLIARIIFFIKSHITNSKVSSEVKCTETLSAYFITNYNFNINMSF